LTDDTLLSAYVLHTRRYGDSSLLAELFVRERGRVACIAKGALRGKRRNGAIQSFQRLSIELRGRGEIGTLTRAEPAAPPLGLAGQRLFCGLYLNELLIKLTARDDAHPVLFRVYAETLAGLADGLAVEPLLRSFEVGLLQELGLGLVLGVDSHGQPVEVDRSYTYELGNGPIRSNRGNGSVIGGKTLLALQGRQPHDAQTLREARALMRRVLDHYLEGRPLRSRELFQSGS
jgi:DNA repair protein RecO (recombination protein O)